MPVMHPAELWQTSGRWELMGEEMFRLKDRKGADLALGMTHEEIVATLATELESYRQLPQMWYQFQTKLRDEPRPKAGLMRTREFTMKDSYSFDLGPAELDVSFAAHRDAYAAHVRAARHPGHPGRGVQRHHGRLGLHRVHLPLADRRGPDRLLPGLRLRGQHREGHVPAGGDRRFCRTDRAACRPRALCHPRRAHHRGSGRAVRGPRRPADQDAGVLPGRHAHPGADARRPRAARAEAHRRHRRGRDPPGPAGGDPRRARRAAGQPRRGRRHAIYPIIADEALRGRRGMYTGANIDDTHLRGVDVERDIAVGRWADLREVAAGEAVRQLRSSAGGGARHRGRPHLQARLQVHRRHRDQRVRPGRQAGPADHGLLRHRRGAGDGRGRRGPPRRARASSGRSRSRRSRSSW